MISFVDPNGPSYWYLKDKRAKLSGSSKMGIVSILHGQTYVGSDLATGKTISAFLYTGAESFIVEGHLLDFMAKLIDLVVNQESEDGYRHKCEFSPYGLRSIDVNVTKGSDKYVQSTIYLPDELVDMKERIIPVLNEATTAIRIALNR